MLSMVQILEHFCKFSGLKINMSKSVLAGINSDSSMIARLSRSIGCDIGSWPMKYLGIPLGGNPIKSEFWEPVISKVSKRLDGWKKAFLS